jgi:hypothetical protein
MERLFSWGGTMMRLDVRYVAIALILQGCAQQAPVDLPTALKGIEKSKFLSCAGPPILETQLGGQDQMAFVTNLQRGQVVGVASPTAFAPESCSVNAVFEHDQLVSSQFSGNLSMCQVVFSPCLP